MDVNYYAGFDKMEYEVSFDISNNKMYTYIESTDYCDVTSLGLNGSLSL